jgi:hypothetical protein
MTQLVDIRAEIYAPRFQTQNCGIEALGHMHWLSLQKTSVSFLYLVDLF